MKKTLKAIKITAVFLATAAIMTACSAKGSIKQGSWDGNTFKNEWSGITAELPEGYKAATPEEMKAAFEAGAEVLINDGTDAATLDLTGLKTVYDFMLVSDDEMSNITLMYENLGFLAETANYSIDEYYTALKSGLLNVTSMDYAEEGKTTATIAGEEFVKGTFSLYDGQLFQDYYIRKLDGAIVAFITTYSEEDKDTVDSFIASITK